MITCKLEGRLGNQMFQIAAVIGTALKYGYEFLLPSQTEDEVKWPKHSFLLPEFNNSLFKNEYKPYNEPKHSYTEIPNQDNICLSGYFQSEKYFKHCRQAILLYFRRGLDNKLMDYVSIHVRRGDYLLYPTKHPVLSIDYYKYAMSLFPDDTKFLIFSDDTDWCKKNFNFKSNIFISVGANEIVDLLGMAACKHHIISNSTYAWWGAWLCTNPNQKVIRPKVWFGEDYAHLDTSDICPEEWIICE